MVRVGSGVQFTPAAPAFRRNPRYLSPRHAREVDRSGRTETEPDSRSGKNPGSLVRATFRWPCSLGDARRHGLKTTKDGNGDCGETAPAVIFAGMYEVRVTASDPPPDCFRWQIFKVGGRTPIETAAVTFRREQTAWQAGQRALGRLLKKLAQGANS